MRTSPLVAASMMATSATLLACGITVVTPAPASAAKCASKTSGVTVVVDLSAFDRPVRVRCARGNPKSGLAALRRADFSVASVPGYRGLICRINDRPQRCRLPGKRYWSYWHAPRGGTWEYSIEGARKYNPKPGWVEGWAFGRGKPPRIAPPK